MNGSPLPVQTTPDGVPVIHVTGVAAQPAKWPMYVAAGAAAALVMAPQKYRTPALLVLGVLGYLWVSGKWPAEAQAAETGSLPADFYGGGQFTGTGAGR